MKLFIVPLIIFLSIAANAADNIAGKAAICAACHGANGMSSNSQWPNLAGQKKDYLAKQLRAFKNGERIDPMMNPLAANLTEQEIEDLAQYFSILK